MPAHRNRPSIATTIVAAALAARLLVGCGAEGSGSQLQSGTVTTAADATSSSTADGDETTTEATATTAAETSTTQPPTTRPSTTVDDRPGSAEAAAYKGVATNLPTFSDGVRSYVEATSEARIDELADAACGAVRPDMDDTELGTAGLDAYGALSEAEQASVAANDWVVFFGSLLGYFCPDRLPDQPDGQPPTDGTPVEQFRAVLGDLDGVSTQAEDFAASITDDRLTELFGSACANTGADMTTEDFGRAIIESYGTDLDEAEQDRIDLSSYSELYGALVGWFCPDKLPL